MGLDSCRVEATPREDHDGSAGRSQEASPGQGNRIDVGNGKGSSFTCFENGVPGQSVRLPHFGVETLVQLHGGHHHLAKCAHHLEETQELEP